MLDITEKKSLEEQYRQSQKMESIGLLAGGVAHDFNNILSAILGYASLIRLENREKESTAFDSRLDEQTNAILNAGDRAADLVRKLLAFSRRGPYEINSLSVHEIIEDVAALLSHSIDKRITITKDLAQSDPIVEGDQSLLESALLNLAVNARDAMPEGGVLTFSTRLITVDNTFPRQENFTVSSGPYVALTVTDTGMGIDDDIKKHIFEPFFTTKGPGKGTGLGLASVFGTVTRHGGFINLQSEKGRGTTITCYLPQSINTVPCGKTPVIIQKSKRPLHVLVVDDESMICHSVSKYLNKEGHSATTFINPTQAVEWYNLNYADVDCILLDMNMPDMDGKTCFVAMQQINPAANALFATGFMVDDAAAIIAMPGIKGYIQKPFTFEQLGEALNTHCERIGDAPLLRGPRSSA